MSKLPAMFIANSSPHKDGSHSASHSSIHETFHDDEDDYDNNNKSTNPFLSVPDKPRRHSSQMPSRSGFLVKEGHFVKSWRKRYFVLKDGVLSYYKNDTDLTTPKGRLSLNEDWHVSRWTTQVPTKGSTKKMQASGVLLTNKAKNAKVSLLRMLPVDGDNNITTDWINDLAVTITLLEVQRGARKLSEQISAQHGPKSRAQPTATTSTTAETTEKTPVLTAVPPPPLPSRVSYAELFVATPPPQQDVPETSHTDPIPVPVVGSAHGYTRLDDEDFVTLAHEDSFDGVDNRLSANDDMTLEQLVSSWPPHAESLPFAPSPKLKPIPDDKGELENIDKDDGGDKLETTVDNNEDSAARSGEGNLYVCINMTLNEINILTQRFCAGITIDFLWENSYTFSPECLDLAVSENASPSMVAAIHLLRHLFRVYRHIEVHGNDLEAWTCDEHIKPFQKMYDPKQGEEWWKYVYRMGWGEYEGVVYIDVMLYLRTSAIPILKNDLGLSNENIPDVLHTFLKFFMHPSYEMRNFYRYTTNFSKMLHQLSDLSHNFNDLEALNKAVMGGRAVYKPDLFENCVDQQETAWPQLCFYPSRHLTQLIWEEGWAGTRIEGTFQEQIELQDYPLDRQLLCLKPKKQWQNASPNPPPGTFSAKQKFFTYSVSPDLLSYSQWRYYPAVMLEQTTRFADDEETPPERAVTYALRVERLLMPYIGSVIVPLFLIVLLALLPLMVSSDSLPERCDMVLTLLLTAVALYFVVKQGLPQVPYITVMEIYVSGSIVLLALVAAESALVSFLDEDAANAVDRITIVFLLSLWMIPHVVLFVFESRGLFRRPWHSVYMSQTKEQLPPLESSCTDKGRRERLPDKHM